MSFRPCLTAIALITVVSVGAASESSHEANGDVPDFSRDVRPILSDHCFACHGPDAAQRQAELRLDTSEGLDSILGAGVPAESQLIHRIDSPETDVVMPPPEFQKPLSKTQREVLRAWIQGGAKFRQHWSYVKPERPDSLDVKEDGVGSIDYFINRRIKQSGLNPNGRADRSTLLRRVCLDLTGLPPSRAQIESFMHDESPEAYERLVDRLLQSPRFGQHVGRHWLDLVRYADTHGLHLDNYREMWAYRDWVIDAINDNMPFDQFITRQLAGDLLPDAGEAERIASGFNRLNVTTNEGGSIYDEVFVRNVMDRTDAFGTVFLGLTTGCAVCHDHKFDPISMRDYYSLFAFFNSLDGRAMDANVKDPAPVVPVPSDSQRTLLAEYDRTLQTLDDEMRGPIASVDQAQLSWEKSLVAGGEARTHQLKPVDVVSEAKVEMVVREDGSVDLIGDAAAKDTTTIVAEFPSGVQWQTLHLEAIVDSPGPQDGGAEQQRGEAVDDNHNRVGASANGNVVLSEITVEMSDSLSPDQWIKVPVVHAFADVEQSDGPFAATYAVDSKIDEGEGWAVAGHQQPGGRNAWFVLSSLLADGRDAKLRIKLDYQSKYARHQFRRVRFSLSDTIVQVPDEQKVELGELHVVGPFPIESPNPGYGRKFASQQSEFKLDETFQHEDQVYSWQRRDDITQVNVNEMPSIPDRSSVVVLHQSITAPSNQKATMLIASDDGYVAYLNGKEVGRIKGPRELNPLSNEHELELKKGANDLYVKLVNHSGPSQLTFAFRSPALYVPDRLTELVSIPERDRSDEIRTALQKYYRKVYCLHPDWLALVNQDKAIRKSKAQLESEVPTTLVWKELATPRQAHILKRGQYDQPGEAVARNTPPFLPSFPTDSPLDRLGLAQWLTSPDHPLTARVAVNRFWQQLFGVGLVRTSEDFGSQGEPPSHPELLDWLAVEFQQNGWDVKGFFRMLVTSDAYCRDAKVLHDVEVVDPDNRLLARGPRHRLDAEVLRDQALFFAQLLLDDRGGPSVKPPQPDGLWAAVGYSGSNTVRFTPDTGDKVYRRSVYTFWKRTSPPPQMSTFDAPSRESCTARRERTNTPLQALLMMNESQYVESARRLGRRALEVEGPSNLQQRMDWIFQTVTARLPDERERSDLMSLWIDSTAYYRENQSLAEKLVGNPNAEAAAWTIVASTILNLDEVVTK